MKSLMLALIFSLIASVVLAVEPITVPGPLNPNPKPAVSDNVIKPERVPGAPTIGKITRP